MASEHKEQCAVIQWKDYSLKKYPELSTLLAIPNGGHRHIGTALKLKAEGVKPGVPDLLLPIARGKWNNLWIELKANNGRPTKNQVHVMSDLTENGGKCVICYGAKEAIDSIISYLAMEKRDTQRKFEMPSDNFALNV